MATTTARGKKRLLDEVSKLHILYRKCIYLSPRPNLESIHRKILKEEFRVLKHPPSRSNEPYSSASD
uniref:Uncharacterized protein n=1 Tax=Oryza nivara TaxID=4536 RepID=A0A0E0HY99_ORYNI